MERALKRWEQEVTEKLRERYAANVCASLICVECGAYYRPDAESANGLCQFCAEQIVLVRYNVRSNFQG